MRFFRYTLYLMATLFWLIALLAAAELWARFDESRRNEAAHAVESALYKRPETASRNQETRKRYPVPELDAPTDFEARSAFLTGQETDREAYVASRKELVLLCGADGVVIRSYGPGPDGVPEIRSLAERSAIGTPVLSILPEQQHNDFKNALAASLKGSTQLRDYPIPQAGTRAYVMQFAFMANTGETGAAEETGVFIRPSMWLELWKSFKPNIVQREGNVFRTNNLGFRDEQVLVPKPSGLFRIVCFGGSTTAEGPANELTYPKILDALLKACYGTDKVEVLNCGIFAITSISEVERFPDILALEPDLVVYYNFVNDLAGLFDKLSPSYRRLNKSAFAYRFLSPRLFHSEDRLAELLKDTTLVNLKAMCDMARGQGAAMAFCSFAAPDYGNASYEDRAFFDWRLSSMLWGRHVNMRGYVHITDLYNRCLERRCNEWNALYLPVAERLKGDSTLFTDICHLHVWGVERKAQIVCDALIPYLDARVTHPDS